MPAPVTKSACIGCSLVVDNRRVERSRLLVCTRAQKAPAGGKLPKKQQARLMQHRAYKVALMFHSYISFVVM
jgi:hypothetical protein